ncbi:MULTISPECIES: CmpA/NrtA family ABC transporter substrate-binding protein [Gluconobacter]|uniref:Nitrate ABC transporter ATP-binding protein n=1 Tax=Gluconobacter aidae TaxID=2662454 RepID=A0A7X1SSS0_9PROT|nr:MULTISPECIES: CmpA/NrtA family ABC transporter substrate-binding protein [Gluconobacter]MBS1087035.1 ABC transporter substrate-binding protein [Gluconobacter sphaericus]MBS1100986.1 ABC transporter substrate-binding protein [Gluconobacter sphaericus]MBS1101733.1 ABC transporter substrate-binding protein [Gluconobacter sp. Dm-62]MQR99375.1 nitrate ABC transporter ATP-binding protein [Gluconobacter aidae]
MSSAIRIGLLRLADSAPLIIARNLGIFEKHGLDAELIVSPSWANIADGLVWNGLDAALVFPPLAIMTALGHRGREIGLHRGIPISRGGNTVVLRGQHLPPFLGTDDVTKHRNFESWRTGLSRRPKLAVVHLYSTHFLILMDFLKSLHAHPEQDVEIVIMPPDRMIDALAAAEIDGFCAGPPWGTEADLHGLGSIVAGSANIHTGHLEKTLVTTQRWGQSAPALTQALQAAIGEATRFCMNPSNSAEIVRQLSSPLANGGLALPREATEKIMPDQHNLNAMQFDFSASDVDLSISWMIRAMQAQGWLTPANMKRLYELGWLTPAPIS